MRAFICQDRYMIAKSRHDLRQSDTLKYSHARCHGQSGNDNFCVYPGIACPPRTEPHNREQTVDIEASRLIRAGLTLRAGLIQPIGRSRIRPMAILYRQETTICDNFGPTSTYHNLISTPCLEWAAQKQETQPHDWFEINKEKKLMSATSTTITDSAVQPPFTDSALLPPLTCSIPFTDSTPEHTFDLPEHV